LMAVEIKTEVCMVRLDVKVNNVRLFSISSPTPPSHP
jgi:hypothetical protein